MKPSPETINTLVNILSILIIYSNHQPNIYSLKQQLVNIRDLVFALKFEEELNIYLEIVKSLIKKYRLERCPQLEPVFQQLENLYATAMLNA